MNVFNWDPSIDQIYSSEYGTYTETTSNINKNINKSFIMDAPGETYTLQLASPLIEDDSIFTWGVTNHEGYGQTSIFVKNGTFNVIGNNDVPDNISVLFFGEFSWNWNVNYKLDVKTIHDSNLTFKNHNHLGLANNNQGVSLNASGNSQINMLNIGNVTFGDSTITTNGSGKLNIEATGGLEISGRTEINGIPEPEDYSLRLILTSQSDHAALRLEDAYFNHESVSLIESPKVLMSNCTAKNKSAVKIKADKLTYFDSTENIISVQDNATVNVSPYSNNINYVYDFYNQIYSNVKFNFIRNGPFGSSTCSIRLAVMNNGAIVASKMMDDNVLSVNGDSTRSILETYLKFTHDTVENIKYITISLK
jgi:hypothetical protein